MGEFLSRLSSRSRLTWIIALIVFVAGASVGGYLIYKRQIFAASETAAKVEVKVAFNNYAKTTSVATNLGNLMKANSQTKPYRCSVVTLYMNSSDLNGGSTAVAENLGNAKFREAMNQISASSSILLYSNDTVFDSAVTACKNKIASNSSDKSCLEELNRSAIFLSLKSACQGPDSDAYSPGLTVPTAYTNVAAPVVGAAPADTGLGSACIKYKSDGQFYPAVKNGTGTNLYYSFFVGSEGKTAGPEEVEVQTDNTKCATTPASTNPAAAPAAAPTTVKPAGSKCFKYNKDSKYYWGKPPQSDSALFDLYSPTNTSAVSAKNIGISELTLQADDTNCNAVASAITITTVCKLGTKPGVSPPVPVLYTKGSDGQWTGDDGTGPYTQAILNEMTDTTGCKEPPTTNTSISEKIKFVFTADGKDVINAAVAKFTTANDKEEPESRTKALSHSTNIVSYTRPKDKEELKIRGFKDFKDPKNEKNEFTRIFAKCGESELLTINKDTPPIVQCKFTNFPKGMENDQTAKYTETDGNNFVIYTPTDMPIGTSSIYFRAVRYSYAGAGFTEFPQFAPVGGADFIITLVSASKTTPKTGMLGAEKALAQAPTVVDNWVGYKCYSILGGLPVARKTQPINSVLKGDECFATAGDPKTDTCAPTKFARQTTGTSPLKYAFMDKEDGGTRYPKTTDNQGVANPSPPTCDQKNTDVPANNPSTDPRSSDVVADNSTAAVASADECWHHVNNNMTYYFSLALTDKAKPGIGAIVKSNDPNYPSGSINIPALKAGNPAEFNDLTFAKDSMTTCNQALGTTAAGAPAAAPAGNAAGTGNQTQVDGGGQLPTAIAPWNQERVKPYSRSVLQGMVDGFKRTVGFSNEVTISGTIPDNGIRSGVMLAQLPAGIYKISVTKDGYSTSTFMFEVGDNEDLDLKGLSIAPGTTVREAPSINADVIEGKYGTGMSLFVADQLQLTKERERTLLFAKRGTAEKGFAYHPSYPGVGWIPGDFSAPTGTTYSDEVPGVPIFTQSNGAGQNVPWTGVPAGTAGRAVSDCATLFKADGLTDTQAGIAAAGLIGNALFEDKTAKDISMSVAMLALASGSSSVNVLCNGGAGGYGSQYATSPHCCDAGVDCKGLLPSCLSTQPLMQNILSIGAGLLFRPK